MHEDTTFKIVHSCSIRQVALHEARKLLLQHKLPDWARLDSLWNWRSLHETASFGDAYYFQLCRRVTDLNNQKGFAFCMHVRTSSRALSCRPADLACRSITRLGTGLWALIWLESSYILRRWSCSPDLAQRALLALDVINAQSRPCLPQDIGSAGQNLALHSVFSFAA